MQDIIRLTKEIMKTGTIKQEIEHTEQGINYNFYLSDYKQHGLINIVQLKKGTDQEIAKGINRWFHEFVVGECKFKNEHEFVDFILKVRDWFYGEVVKNNGLIETVEKIKSEGADIKEKFEQLYNEFSQKLVEHDNRLNKLENESEKKGQEIKELNEKIEKLERDQKEYEKDRSKYSQEIQNLQQQIKALDEKRLNEQREKEALIEKINKAKQEMKKEIDGWINECNKNKKHLEYQQILQKDTNSDGIDGEVESEYNNINDEGSDSKSSPHFSSCESSSTFTHTDGVAEARDKSEKDEPTQNPQQELTNSRIAKKWKIFWNCAMVFTALLSMALSAAVFALAERPDCLPSYSDYKGAAFVTFYICDICCFIASIVLYWVSFVKLGLEDDNTPCLFVIIIYILGLVSGVLCGIVVKDEVGRVGLGLWISGLVLFIIGFIVIAAYYYKKRGFNMPVLMRVIICAYIVPAVFALSLVGGAFSFEKIPDKHYVLESDGTYSYVMDESSYGAEVLFIHARYDGKPVTKVAKSQTLSDEANYNLKKIIIPVSVNDIEMGILSGCENLEDLIVPYVGYSDVGAVNGYDGEAEYIRPIGWLFGTASFDGGVETKQNYYVKYLSGTKKGNSNYFSQTYYIPRKLKHVTVLGGDVCNGAFYKCTNISEITLSEGVTSIGSVAFSGCTGLTSLSLPDSITSIATRAFYECTGLTSLKMSGNITNFGVGVLDRCNNFESLTTPYVGFKEIVNDKEYIRPLSYLFSSNIPSTLKMVTVLGGEICDEAFSGCNHITRITLSEGVTSIGSKAFSRCTSLTSINIPNGVTSIGAEAFSGCTGLTSINLPNGVTSIGSKAFAECTRLSSIDIPNSLTRIGVEAFANCISLTSLNIPNSVTSTGTRLLMGCNNLESLTIPYVGYRYNSDVKDYDGEAELIEPIGFLFGTASFNGGVETRQYYCCKYISGTKAGQEDSFYCSYYIPSKLKHVAVSRGSICAGAFYGCANISEITLSKGVTSIGAEAFSGCTSLTSINIPNSVTSIGSKAFSGCTWLTLLKLPGSATDISEGILSGCHNLKSLTVPFIGYHLDGEENAWVTESIEPLGWLFGEDEFVASEKTRQYAFRKICIIPGPNGSAPEPIVTAEFGYDYYIPRALKQVTVLGGDLCAGAFSMCTWITEITLSEGVTSIGEKAFYGCTSLTKVHIPNSLTKIEKDAFVNSGVIEGRSGAIYVGHWVVGVTESVTKLGLSSGTIGIADCAFEQSGITEISFNSELKYIGANAFNGCSELQAVRFPIYYSYFYEGYWCADDIHISGTDLSRPKVAARYLKTTYKDKRWERRVKQE